ncbi:MAG: hypothetical protein M0Z85_09435 [Gammaproteobacteria bacterium]|nr:hypothetical protein [Gammaproteobacteria bacterium]
MDETRIVPASPFQETPDPGFRIIERIRCVCPQAGGPVMPGRGLLVLIAERVPEDRDHQDPAFLVLLADRPYNCGASMTNAIEKVIPYVLAACPTLAAHRRAWVELDSDGRFDEVRVTQYRPGNINVTWHPMTVEKTRFVESIFIGAINDDLSDPGTEIDTITTRP